MRFSVEFSLYSHSILGFSNSILMPFQKYVTSVNVKNLLLQNGCIV